MPQPPTIIDAPSSTTVRHGTPTATFSTAGVLVAENLRWTKGTRAIRQMDKDGMPLKAAYVPEWGEGSITVQLKNSSTRVVSGETITFLDTDGSTSVTGIVTSIGPTWTNGDATKIEVNFAEKINA